MEHLYKSYRIRLEPNNKQLTAFRKHAGCARYAYNWAVETHERIYYESGLRADYVDLCKMFVRMEKSKHEWLYEVSKCCMQKSIINHSKAIRKFHAIQMPKGYSEKRILKKKCEDGKPVYVLKGLPQKKKKGRSVDSFYLETDSKRIIQFSKYKIKLPTIGWVRCSEELPFGVSIMNCTIKRQADSWFVIFRTKIEPMQHENQGRVGVDLGIKKLATCSNGVVFDSPKRYKELDAKLKREQRKLSRMYEAWNLQNGDRIGANMLPKSHNFEKQKKKIAKIHKRIFDHRRDCIHKATAYLTKNHSQVVIEDLSIRNMLKNHNLARSIANGGWYEFRRQLEYKGEWYGCEIIVASKSFPSSKMCNNCKEINKELKLSDRIWTCKNCGVTHERDKNAADNLEDFPIGGYAASCAVKACGERSSVTPKASRSLSVKQETNVEPSRV